MKKNKNNEVDFEFDYNKTYTDIITALRIVKIYSLPYINKLNNWVINDIDTNINSINDVNNGIKTMLLFIPYDTKNSPFIIEPIDDEEQVKKVYDKYKRS